MRKRAYKIFMKFVNKMDDDHIGAYAGSTAFFTFLSLFPMLMLLLSILPYTRLEQETLLSFMAKIMPWSINSVVEEIVNDLYHASTAVLPVTIIFTVWSSAKGSLSLLRALNVIYEVEEKRNYFILRLRATIYTLAMLIMIILLLIGVVFARAIRDAVVLHFPASKFMFDFFTAARRFFVPAVLTLIFTALYTYLPNVKNKFHWELPGALFTAVAWYFVSWVFSIFVNTVTFANT